MSRRVSVDKSLGGARKIPTEGDLSPALVDEFMNAASASRGSPLTEAECIGLSKRIREIAHDYALDQYRERPVPIEQLRQDLKDYLRRQRRIERKRLNREQKRIASQTNRTKPSLDQGLTTTAAYKLAIEHLEDPNNPETAAERALEQLEKGAPGRPNHRTLDAEFISRVRQACAEYGVEIEGRFHTKKEMLIHTLFECMQQLRRRRLTYEAFPHIWRRSSSPKNRPTAKLK